MLRRLLPAIFVLGFFTTGFFTTAAAQGLDLSEVRHHAEFLNSAEVGPRLPGEPGIETAARYIAVQLGRYGFAGAGPEGSFFLDAGRDVVRPGPGCLVAARQTDASRVLRPGEDFAPFAWSATGKREGSVALLGPGGDPELGPDVAGRVIVWAGAPPAGLRARVDRAARRGALAVLVAPDPRTDTVDVVEFRDGRRQEGSVVDRGRDFDFCPAGEETVRRLTLAEVERILLRVPAGPQIGTPPWPAPETAAAIPVIAISGRAAAAILGRPIGGMLEALATSGRKGPVAAEGVSVRLAVDLARETLPARHVTGVTGRGEGAPKGPPVVLEVRYDGGQTEGRTAALALEAARQLGRRTPGPGLSRPIEVRFLVGPPILWRYTLGPGETPPEAEEVVKAVLAEASLDPESAPPEEGADVPPAPAAPNPTPGTREAARQARLTGQLARARSAIEVALDASPKDPLLHLERGRVLLASGDLAGAREAVDTLGRLAPAPADPAEPAGPRSNREAGLADLLLYEVLSSEGRRAEAHAALARAAEMELPEAVVERALALARVVEGTQPKPVGPLVKSPKELEELADRGGPFGMAVAELESVLPVLGESALGDSVRGILSYWSGRAVVAREILTGAVEKDPFLGLAWYYRAVARLEEPFDLDGAVGDCTRAIEVGFADAEVWFQRGMAHLRAKRFTAAIRDFGERAARDPGSPNGINAVYNIACAYALMGNREAAFDWLGMALTRGFGDLLHAEGDPDFDGIRDDPRFETILRSKQAE